MYYLSLYLTYNCNLNCIYCYEKEKNSSILKNDKILQLERWIQWLGLERIEMINLMGGEPLLNLIGLKHVIQMADYYKIKTTLTTNGLLLNDELCNYCRKYNVSVTVSIDGTYETQICNRGFISREMYKGVIDNILTLQKSDVNTLVRMTCNPENIDCFYDNVTYLWQQGIRKIRVGFNYFDKWSTSNVLSLDKQLDKLDEFYEKEVLPDKNSLFDLYDNCIKNIPRNKYLLIDVDGNIYPSGYVREKGWVLGNIANLVLDENVELREQTSKQCRNCQLYSRCYLKRCLYLGLKLTGEIGCFPEYCCQIISKVQEHKTQWETGYEKSTIK